MKTGFSKKHALLSLLMLIAVIPPAVRNSWGQAAGGGSAQWTFETIRSSVSLNALSLTIVPSGGNQIPAVAFTQGGNTLKFAARSESDATPWVNEDLLASTSFTSVQDLALVADNSGMVNLIYYHDLSTDGTNVGGLRFLRKASLSALWPTTPPLVGAETGKFGNSGQHLVAALDPATSSPCIAYRRDWSDPANQLFYSCYDTAAATWSAPAPTAITTAVSTSGVNNFIALGIEPTSSRARFAYTQQSVGSYSLHHVSRSSAGVFGTTASVALSSPSADNNYKDLFIAGSNAHVFYYDPTTGNLMYGLGKDSNSAIATTPVDTGGAADADVGQYVSTALCPNGSAHVSYYDATNRALKYARCLLSNCTSGGSWSNSFVDPETPSPATINRGQYSQIACDANNVVHIAYYDATASEVKYAVPSICGNGIREGTEVCDDGNIDACSGTCNATCTAAVTITGCGDGVVCPPETCDDRGAVSGDGCSDACVIECGNGVCGPGENNFSCPADCPTAVCGNGACETGENNSICPADCPAVCGNGFPEVGEICDDGNTLNCDGCRGDCSAIETGCGDGFTCAATEVCDDGNQDDCLGSCRADCTAVVAITSCGDGIICGAEQCDDGNTLDCDGCRGDCSAVETGCGDRFICGAEQCDDDNMTSGDGCSGTCTNEVTPACGDSILQAGEECDDGNTTVRDGCNATCRREVPPRCGDEACNGDETCTTCPGDCGRCAVVAAVCGNNVKEGEEECDDGNMNSGDGCSPTCRNEAPATTDVRPVSPTIGTTGAEPANGTGDAGPNSPPLQTIGRSARGGGFSCALIR